MSALDWAELDTVLLDLDGVLIDLRFDNEFWMRVVPRHYARMHGLSQQCAEQKVFALYRQRAGSLDWYCIEHWSMSLGLDILLLMRSLAERVSLRPQAREFLERLRRRDCRVLVLTNAHPEAMAIKLERTGIGPLLHHSCSTHELGLPKEAPGFWEDFCKRRPFDLQRTLFIDDNEDILHNARRAGIRRLLTVRRPDSERPARENLQFPAIDSFAELSP